MKVKAKWSKDPNTGENVPHKDNVFMPLGEWKYLQCLKWHKININKQNHKKRLKGRR